MVRTLWNINIPWFVVPQLTQGTMIKKLSFVVFYNYVQLKAFTLRAPSFTMACLIGMWCICGPPASYNLKYDKNKRILV